MCRQVTRFFEFKGCFKFSNVYIYRLNKYEPMEGRKTVMFWSSRCCTARCQMDSHFQQGAKCLSGAACMVWADWQYMKQLAQSIIGLRCCFYLSHSLQYLCLCSCSCLCLSTSSAAGVVPPYNFLVTAWTTPPAFFLFLYCWTSGV